MIFTIFINAALIACIFAMGVVGESSVLVSVNTFGIDFYQATAVFVQSEKEART